PAVTVMVIASMALAPAALYLLPVLIAWIRRAPDIGAVAAINVLLGWTLIGWGAALTRALRSARPPGGTGQIAQRPPPSPASPNGKGARRGGRGGGAGRAGGGAPGARGSRPAVPGRAGGGGPPRAPRPPATPGRPPAAFDPPAAARPGCGRRAVLDRRWP